jgi:ketopantoate reductase
MRIAMMGSGGIGGYLGARLAVAGEDVVFIARGAHLDELRRNGLRLRSPLGDVPLPRSGLPKGSRTLEGRAQHVDGAALSKGGPRDDRVARGGTLAAAR